MVRLCDRVNIIKMLSKTILLGLSLFQYGSEASVHGCPSCEIASYDPASKTTQDFSLWSKHVATECSFHERAGECGILTAQSLTVLHCVTPYALLQIPTTLHDNPSKTVEHT